MHSQNNNYNMDKNPENYITIEKIISRLNIDQEKIPNNYRFGVFDDTEGIVLHQIGMFENSKPLPYTFSKIYNNVNSLVHYQYDFLEKDTFLQSIILIVKSEYMLFSKEEKLNFIKSCRITISQAVNENNFHKKMQYKEILKYKKKSMYQLLNNDDDIDSDNMSLQVIVDYFNINIIIYNVDDSNNIISVESIFSKRDINNMLNPYLSTFLFIRHNGKFNPILYEDHNCELYMLKHDSENVLYQTYRFANEDLLSLMVLENKKRFDFYTESEAEGKSENDSTQEQSEQKINKNLDKEDYEKLNRSDLQDLCKTNKISIYKSSEKTNKQILKIKKELIDDLCKIESYLVKA